MTSSKNQQAAEITVKKADLKLSNVRQYFAVRRNDQEKFDALCSILDCIEAGQCIVFVGVSLVPPLPISYRIHLHLHQSLRRTDPCTDLCTAHV